MRTITTKLEFDSVVEISEGVRLSGSFYLTRKLYVSGTGEFCVSGTSKLYVSGIGTVLLSGPGRLDVSDTGELCVCGTGKLLVCRFGKLVVSGAGKLAVDDKGALLMTNTGKLVVTGNGKVLVDGKAIACGEQASENLRRIALLALGEGGLQMSDVHRSERTHCIAGWACHSLPTGPSLEERHRWYTAGLALLGLEAATHFFDSDAEARMWLGQYLPRETETTTNR